MPELPEVEIIRRELLDHTIGKKITAVESSDLKLRKEIPTLEHLVGQKITAIHRRNKYLILETNHNWIVIHLGMTGQLLYSKNGVPIQKHIHFKLLLTKDECLYYVDPRRFGLIEGFYKSTYPYFNSIPLFSNLGIEPLGHFEEEDFLSLFKNKKTAKSFLLDGSMVCGLGNIYANEILFLSNIHPQENILSLSEQERKILFSHIKPTLLKAIELGGSSISDYVHTNGTKGEMQKFYNVYGRDKKPCNCCGTIIEKISQNGRSSFFCPSCQPLKNEIKTKKRTKKTVTKK